MKLFHQITNTAVMNDFEPQQYSGRGMYSRTCLGISGDRESIMEVVAEIATQLMEDTFNKAVERGEGAEHVNMQNQQSVRTLLGFKMDSLGHNVIMYWPDIEWEDLHSEEEDDESEE